MLGGEAGEFAVLQRSNPPAAIQWQTCAAGVDCAPGSPAWADLGGETGAALSVPTAAANGGLHAAGYRVTLTNSQGTVVSTAAELSVHYLPEVTSEPVSALVEAGGEASFATAAIGSPQPEIEWQRRVAGFWEPIDAADAGFSVAGGTLTIGDAGAELSGTELRARAHNLRGSDFTRIVTLTVKVADAGRPQPPPAAPPASAPRIDAVAIGALRARTTVASLACPAPADCVVEVPRAARLGAAGRLDRLQRRLLARGRGSPVVAPCSKPARREGWYWCWARRNCGPCAASTCAVSWRSGSASLAASR